MAQRFEISRGVVGASFTPARQRAAHQIFDDSMVSQAAGSSTADVYPGRVSPVPHLENMIRSIAEQTVAKVQSSSTSVPEQGNSTSMSSSAARAGDKQSGTDKRRFDKGQIGKRFSRAVEIGEDSTPRRPTGQSLTPADVQLFQNMQSELTKMATERGKLLADRERMAKEISQLKSQQSVMTSQPAQQEQRRASYYYQRNGSNGYYDQNQGYGSPQSYDGGAASSLRGGFNGQPRRCWICHATDHLARSCPQGVRSSQHQQQVSNQQNVGMMRCNAIGQSDCACYLPCPRSYCSLCHVNLYVSTTT